MALGEWFNRLFFEEYWAIAFRWLTASQAERLTCDTRIQHFTLAAAPRGAWAADPFLFRDGGETYLFCEVVKKHHKRGVIGCAKWENGRFSRPKPVLTLPCHTSYPAVFRYGDGIYMIPETRATRSVELYRAVRFPEEWAHAGTLLTGYEIEDATPLITDDGVLLMLYAPDDRADLRRLYLAPLDPAACRLGALTLCATYRARLGRPAGMVQQTSRGFVRPTQHSINRYGERIVYKRMERKDGYLEYDVATLSPSSIRLDQKRRLLGVHTINRLDDLEVIDVFYRRFMPLRPLSALLSRIRGTRQ